MVRHYNRYATLQALGYARATKTIRHRLMQEIQKHLPTSQPTSWHQLQQLGMDQNSLSRDLIPLQALQQYYDHTKVRALADQYKRNCFDVLGSTEQCFMDIPWHRDIRLYAQNPQAACDFDAQTYYKNSTITPHSSFELGKDIKVPWEFARFQYAPILGLAYQMTHDTTYAIAAQQQIHSWINANPLCYGIHWVNGMEVAIRAVNWIIALQWLDKFFVQDTAFYQRLLCSLYDHLRYLEKNWEWYDGRTNNHYLANLVGYGYLCAFFKRMPSIKNKWSWCYTQLVQECAWQVFDEGTSYEGSTRYHVLVTELFLHGFLLARTMGETVDTTVLQKLTKMRLFIEQCKPRIDGDPITIGDDDSGSLLDQRVLPRRYLYDALGITTTTIPHNHYYPKFGISLSTQHHWHVSLRHHAYTNRQPTGHFHYDTGSITIAYKGIPIIVDPGTYVYTASSYWRNYFRSAAVHNTIYTASLPDDSDLFSMPLKSVATSDIFMTACIPMPSGMIKRTIVIEEYTVRIIDHCMFDASQLLTWHFTFAPQVNLYQKDSNTWYISTKHHQCTYHSTMPFSQSESWTSSRYGHSEKTLGLQGSQSVTQQIIESSFSLCI